MLRRDFFGRLVGAAVAGSVGTDERPTNPTPPVAADIQWKCANCQHEHSTPSGVWPSVKFNLRCTACGRVQHYALYLRGFDPNPTYYPGETGQFAFATPSSGTSSMPQTPLRAPEPQELITERRKREIRDRLKRPRRVFPLP